MLEYKESDIDALRNFRYSDSPELKRMVVVRIVKIDQNSIHTVDQVGLPAVRHNNRWYVQGKAYNMPLSEVVDLILDHAISKTVQLDMDTLMFSQVLSAQTGGRRLASTVTSSISDGIVLRNHMESNGYDLYTKIKSEFDGKGLVNLRVLIEPRDTIKELKFLQHPVG